MRWIGHNGNFDLGIVGSIDALGGRAQMVFDVARPLFVGLELRVELIEDLLEWLARHVGQPRCGMPIMTVSTPRLNAVSIKLFMAGMSISQSSRPNRFSELHFFAKNSSNRVARISLRIQLSMSNPTFSLCLLNNENYLLRAHFSRPLIAHRHLDPRNDAVSNFAYQSS